MNAGQVVTIKVGTNQPDLRLVQLADLQRAEYAKLKRANAITARGEDLVSIAKRVLEWEAAGYIRYSKTADLCRSVLAQVEGRAS